MTDKWKTEKELAQRLVQLRAVRDRAMDHVLDHERALKDREMRGALLKDAVHDALFATKPLRYLSRLLKTWNQ